MSAGSYVGGELELFAQAANWKRYWTGLVRPLLGGDVLEVGAGIGANTAQLRPAGRRWVCLEPDPALAARIPAAVPDCEVVVGTIEALPPAPAFDAALYLDVLEHIEDDHQELVRARERLRPGGRLIVLAPAHGWLFSPFDAAVGHHRRYDRRRLLAASPPDVELERACYLDSVGMLASIANRAMLRQALPTAAQIATWDRLLVPCSRWLDPLTGGRLGKSILVVWKVPGRDR